MGTPREPPPVKLIAGVLAASPHLLSEARQKLEEEFGSIEAASEPELWTASQYYCREMGPHLLRQFLAFGPPVAPDSLVGAKLAANELERRWAGPAGRLVNVDPGYVDLDKLVLASTKNAPHRIYLGRGIYAEVTLCFVAGSFVPLPHTYPDYAQPRAREFFGRVREAWRRERRERNRGAG
jgi:hypothetical protein